MRVEVFEVIERSAEVVFRFVAVDHVRNHPRWDPNMSLQQLTPGPLGVGTMIRRRYLHGGQQVEGEMEVVEFDPGRAMSVVIRDGAIPIRSRMSVAEESPDRTRLAVEVEAEVPVERMDPAPIQGSLRRIKELIESEG